MHAMITIYGIRNCDTVRKSLEWFDDRQIPYVFHDFRKQGLDETVLRQWLSSVGWENLVNRKGTTWRKLGLGPEQLADPGSAVTLIRENTSLIRRPVVVHEPSTAPVLGYQPQIWQAFGDVGEEGGSSGAP